MARTTASPIPSRELALRLAHCCLEKGGEEVRVLELPAGSPLCDYIVLAGGRSDRQANALAEDAFRFCKEHKVPHLPVEGNAGWMLVDCFDVVVHTANPEARALYMLDTLWKQGRDLDVEAEIKLLPKL